MTDVVADAVGFTVAVSAPGEGTVSVSDSAVPSATVGSSGDAYSVAVAERPTGQLAVDGLDPGDYIKSLASADTVIAVNVDGSGNATVKHNDPGIATTAYAGYPTVIRTDATGHIVAITVETDKADYRTEIGLGSAATREAADFLGVDNTSIYGRSFATSVDSAAARSFLGLGSASVYGYGDFSPSGHTHSATEITSGRLDYERLPNSLDVISTLEVGFQTLYGGLASTSTWSVLSDMFIDGSRFNGGQP